MNKLERYLAKFVALNIFIVLLVLVGLFLFFMFIEEANDIGEGNYNAPAALQYVALQAPKWIYELLPVSVLLGTLMGLGIFANNSELTVMRAAGVSIANIGMAVFKAVVLLLLLVMVMDDVLAPRTTQFANNLRSIAKSGLPAIQSGRAGFWLRDGARFIHIDELQPNGRLRAVTVYEFDAQRRLHAMSRAESAYYRQGQWLVHDLVQTLPGDKQVTTAKQAQAVWTSTINPEILNILVLKPDDLSISELYGYIQYLKAGNQNAAAYELNLWLKAVYPFTTLVMVLLALPFVFGSLRTIAVGQRILGGALLGVGFHILNETVTHMGLLYGLPPLLSAALPTLVFLGVALLMMWRKLGGSVYYCATNPKYKA